MKKQDDNFKVAENITEYDVESQLRDQSVDEPDRDDLTETATDFSRDLEGFKGYDDSAFKLTA